MSARAPPYPRHPQRADIHHLTFRLDAREVERLSSLIPEPSSGSVRAARRLVELVRTARTMPLDGGVCVHTPPSSSLAAVLATSVLRSRGATVLHWARGPEPVEHQAGLSGWAQRRVRARAAVLGETPDDVARLGTAGAESWLAPFVTQPTDAEQRRERATWGVSGPCVLFVGPADGPVAVALAAARGSAEGSTIVWGPGEPGTEAGSVHYEPTPTTSSRVPAAIAAADVLVLTDGHAYAPRLQAIASRVGTPCVVVAEAATVDEVRAALEAPAAPATDDTAEARRMLERIAAGAAGGGSVERSGPTDVAVVAWTNQTGRTLELAQALGGEGRTFYDLNLTDRRLIPLRYALSSIRTVAYLVRRRPRVLVIANPPIIPPVIAFVYQLLTGARVLLDSQTASFGEKNSRIGQLTLPLHRFIARRSTCTLVGAEPLAERVREWGGDAMVFHEAPPTWTIAPPAPRGPVLRALWIGVFASDEPLDALLGAAARMPEVEFRVTGDLRKAPVDRDDAPPNVVWLGFVRGGAFPAEIEAADIVITMTTDPGSALRGGAEAAFAERPLITTDVPFLRGLFPHAVHADNDAASIVAAIRQIDGDWPAARAEAARGVAVQDAGWLPQLAQLQHWSGIEAAPASS